MEIMKITETWVKLPQGGSFIYEYNTTGSLFEIRTNNITITSDISHKLYIPEGVDVEIRSVSGDKKISFIPLDSVKPTKEFLEKYGDLVNLINEKAKQQDEKINQAILDIQELKKEHEIVEVDYSDEVLYVKEYDKNTVNGASNRYLKIGNYYIPFLVKKLFTAKQDVFDLELVKGEKYRIDINEFIENDGRFLGDSLESDNEQVTSNGLHVDIEVSDSITATLTQERLDKPVVLNITAIDELNIQKVVDSLELTTSYGNKVLKLNHILPEAVEVDVIKYVFDKEVAEDSNNSYETFRNSEGENNTLIAEGQNSITTNRSIFVSFPYSTREANLIKVEIIKDGQSYIKTFEPQEELSLEVGV